MQSGWKNCLFVIYFRDPLFSKVWSKSTFKVLIFSIGLNLTSYFWYTVKTSTKRLWNNSLENYLSGQWTLNKRLYYRGRIHLLTLNLTSKGHFQDFKNFFFECHTIYVWNNLWKSKRSLGLEEILPAQLATPLSLKSPFLKGAPSRVDQPVTNLTSGLEPYFGLY